MPSGDMTRVLGILSSLYRHVETLEEFANHTVFREGQRAVLIEPTDTTRFISFVRGVFVCTDKTLQDVPSCNQISTVPELLAFVLNNIKRKKKRNVLAHGYGYTFQDRDADQFKFHGEITQSAAYIHGSDLWKRICQRLGTDVSKYLLESCSLFVTVPPSSAFQVCGVPVYDRVSMSTGISRFHLGYKRNGTTRNSRGRSKEVRNGGWVFQGSDGRKRRRDGGRDTGKRKGDEVSLGGKRKREEVGLGGKGKRKREEVEGDGCLPGKRRCTQRESPTVSSGTSDRKHRTLETNGVKRPVEVISLTKGPTQSLQVFNGSSNVEQVSAEMECLRKPMEQLSGPGRPLEAVMVTIAPAESSKQVSDGTGNIEQMSMKTGHKRPAAVVQRPVEEQSGHVSATVHVEGGPSWRTGSFPPLPHSQCFIRTLGMLYGGRGMRRFLLNRKRKSRDEGPRRLQGRDLVRLVFFEGVAYLNGTERKPERLPRRFFTLVPLFCQLLRRHRRCPYSKILQRVCPAVGQGDMASLLPQHSAPHRVYLFVRECLNAVVPSVFWGSDHNRFKFLSSVRNFLSMGKFERMSLAELMWKMKVNDCDWLKISKTGRYPPSELSYRTRVLGQLLAWLLDGYVLGLVRAVFYVTESMGQKNALRFYRYQVWAKLQELALRYYTQLPGLGQAAGASSQVLYTVTRSGPSFISASLTCYLCLSNLLSLPFSVRCLMRLVDDFLLITPNLSQAQTFLKTLMAGVPRYGCVVNPQKVAVNFPLGDGGEGGSCPAGVRLLPLHCLFPWCGLLLNTHTLDVHNNYASYAGLSLRYSLTLGSAHCAGQQMKRKLMSILRFKCHALFLDLKTNSLEAVYSNIYKLVLLHAFRFHACAQSLPFGQKVGGNHSYFLNLIWDLAEYTNQLVRLCNKGLSLGCKALTGSLQYEAVELIYCLAFLLVLSRHRPLYYHLLAPLRTRKRKLEGKLEGLRLARIRQAATPKMPEDFKAIRA
nr:telomerase reverse transcriptase [Oncorhynchus nerka]